MWWCFFLTFQSLRQEAVCACRWRYSTVRVAEAGRSHAVGGVLKESVQQPETIWVNITENVTHQTRLEKKKYISSVVLLVSWSLNLTFLSVAVVDTVRISIQCDATSALWRCLVQSQDGNPFHHCRLLLQHLQTWDKIKNPNRLISHINIYRWMELLQGHRPTLWHTLKIPSDTLRYSLIHSDLLRYSERQQLVPWSFRFLAMTIPSSGNRAILQPEA